MWSVRRIFYLVAYIPFCYHFACVDAMDEATVLFSICVFVVGAGVFRLCSMCCISSPQIRNPVNKQSRFGISCA